MVHCALALIVAFVSLAGLYLDLGAEFLGLAQILVYVGAVGVVLVFAILLTRGGGVEAKSRFTESWKISLGIALVVGASLITAICRSPLPDRLARSQEPATVRQTGELLMTDHVLPLEIIGLVLTVALVGAAVIAMPEPPAGTGRDPESEP